MVFQLQVHCYHVLSPRSLAREHHVTVVTFQILDFIMLGFDVFQQGWLVVKLPAACGTFKVLDALVDCFDVPFQVGLAPD